MSTISVHDDWLSLIEISGPFLAVPVLKEAFPQGLEELNGIERKRLRQAYEEWREALELEDAQFAELHAAWIDEVLSRGLELDEDGKGDVLKRADWCAAKLQASLPEHGLTLSPDLAVIDEQRANKPLLLIQTYAQDVDLDATCKQDGWAATPADRMVQLCRSLGCRLGLVTNGERWMLVDAPVGAVSTFASWYARIWSQEPITLQAFVHLLGIRRFFVDESEQLPALFDRSLKFQDEVTDALGEQVRRAVEVLIQTLDKADQDRNRELLHDVKEPELYEAALTVMMRLVFLLSAEERGLLLMGDERYEANYALSTLRMQLRKESEEILERRWDAWSRLLAIFRAVFGGIEHENLRLPALGGSLFDPDRFPFLEGRAKDSNWRTDAAKPLPIDNRTVLLLLEAIQQFQGRTLSYRALDVEQIGYVYEGLLERTVKRTDEVTLELDATKSAKTPWVKLAELDSARLDGAARLAELLQERSGSSASRVRNDLIKPVDDTLADRLLTACQGDTKLRDRIKPYAHLLRTDPWGYPLVYPADAFIVTTGSDRRETGTHYTPKSLTEAIVAETLTPVAYVGPAEGRPRDQWELKSPAELLDLKICDPAMGSGAFLVQACRWLSDRLVESWSQVEASGKTVSVDGDVLNSGIAKEPLPRDSEARTVIARRLIAERCLYGVDLNPLAVELAKLSIWLVTLAKGRPFGFLDHNLRCGDSLLGIHRLDQLTELSMTPEGKGQQRLFGKNIEKAVHEAIELRQRLRAMPIRDIRDVEAMAHLYGDARSRLKVPESIADAFIGEVFATRGSGSALENALASLAIQAGEAIDGDHNVLATMRRRAVAALSTDLPTDKPTRRPFHWPLEFPEVFDSPKNGFNAFLGNPPFLGGKRLTTVFGEAYTFGIKRIVSEEKGAADLCAYFFLIAGRSLKQGGVFGMVATNSISQGATREIGLAHLEKNGFEIIQAWRDLPWPGAAAVTVSPCVLFNGRWLGDYILNNKVVEKISSFLEEDGSGSEPCKLLENADIASIGTYVNGEGFIVSPEFYDQMLAADSRNVGVLRRYLGSQDINQTVDSAPTRYAIDFSDWPESIASTYKLPFERVVQMVKPHRDKLTRQIHEACFWKHWDRREDFYKKLRQLPRALVCGRVSKHHVFTFADPQWLIADGVVIFLRDDMAFFSEMQSSIHSEWVQRHKTTMRLDTNYSVSRCFLTFPLSGASRDGELHDAGEAYFRLRFRIQSETQSGLTSLYNRFHDPEDVSSDISALRDAHIRMDYAVTAAHGWSVDLAHDFHETKQGIRFTISELARREVMGRLLALNLKRNENAQELLADRKPRPSSRTPRAGRSTKGIPIQPSFDFDPGAASSAIGGDPATAVLSFLSTHHTGWHPKADVLAATGITDGQWNTAIADLLASGQVERQGEKRGARYRYSGATQ
ncbi:Eco57I restriction-modification methylase domain-containing protein [Burkholderia ubonensis]|uniref:Eco57I restriction-modification methylase domain-containing protein n=1 Tax=Burkholderia ubonensis TaxID=101571 RepID=UPI000759F516|nr:DNA methyltransferase [Burkholderia ubonensis]KVO11424.1 ATP phosphoribosyltransferase regulatory subunit [Burkholderia ubonensis]KVV21877.1 ATP phosphoribosyltransferase regulatory subunit [Burkholderia ubonensis]